MFSYFYKINANKLTIYRMGNTYELRIDSGKMGYDLAEF